MSSLPYALRDTTTMVRRDARHSLRRLSMTLSGLLTPVIMLALFNYVLGGAISAGLGGGSYINYVAPAILIMTIGSGCATTAINLVVDLSEGIITRFRTMAISRAAVLAGPALGNLIRTLITIALVLGVALLMGFRPTTNPLYWLEALGLIALFAFALTWWGVLFGLVGKTPAGANSLSLIFQMLLPFTSSAFVRPELMAPGWRWFAQYQPFTPVTDSLRALLLGVSPGNSLPIALAWCVGLAIVGYILARVAFNRIAAQ